MPKSGLHRLPQVRCPLLAVYSQFKNAAAFPYQSLLCKSRIKDAGACTLPWLPGRNCLYPSFVAELAASFFVSPMRFCPRFLLVGLFCVPHGLKLWTASDAGRSSEHKRCTSCTTNDWFRSGEDDCVSFFRDYLMRPIGTHGKIYRSRRPARSYRGNKTATTIRRTNRMRSPRTCWILTVGREKLADFYANVFLHWLISFTRDVSLPKWTR